MNYKAFITLGLCCLFAYSGLSQPAEGSPTNSQNSNADDTVLQRNSQFDFWIEEDPFQKKGNPEPSTVRMDLSGNLTFPICKGSFKELKVKAEGKTVSEVRRLVSNKLKEKHYKKATVNLKLLVGAERRNAMVYFRGAIQGVLPLEPNIPKKLSEAIMEKNLPEYANLKKVELRRENPITRERKLFKVDVDHIIKNGDTKNKDMILQDNDTITIKQKIFQF